MRSLTAAIMIFAVSLAAWSQSGLPSTGFEDGMGGWSVSVDGDGEATAVVSQESVKSGNNACKVTVNAPGGARYGIKFINESISVVEGRLALSFWGRVAEGQATVYGRVDNANGDWQVGANITMDTQWRQFLLPFTAWSSSSGYKAYFEIASNVATFYFDDI